jgi:hypothetical protein
LRSAPTTAPGPRPVTLLPAKLAAVACAAAIAVLLAGCGSSHTSGTSVDPAGAVPASAPVYVGATVRPGGSQKTAALSAGRALTHQADPYLRLLEALQTPGSAALSFKRDVAPWLGPHAGVFLSSLRSASSLLTLLEHGLLGGSASSAAAFRFGASGAQGAIVLDTSDAAKARSFLDTQAQHAGAHSATYRGIAYHSTAAGAAFGLVDRLAVIGSESGLRSVIDTTLGGPPLARTSGYSKLLAAAPSGALAHVYWNPVGSSADGTQEGLAGLVMLLAGGHQVNVSLVPSEGALALDADTLASNSPGTTGGLLSSDPQSAAALGELPGDSWLAIGLGHLSTTITQDVQALRGLASVGGTPGGSGEGSSSGALNFKSLLEGLLTPLNALGANSAQAKRDFASWMGSAGMFGSGGSLLELRAAIVITSKNPALSRAAVSKLAAQLRRAGASLRPATIAGADAAVGVALNGLPVTLDVADGRASNGQTKFVMGFGEASVAAALNPPSTLAGAAPRGAAAAALGEGIQPSVILELPTLVSLLEGAGLTEDPSISAFVPYLRAATTLAGGGRPLGGEVQRFRLVLGLQRGG